MRGENLKGGTGMAETCEISLNRQRGLPSPEMSFNVHSSRVESRADEEVCIEDQYANER